MAYLLRVDLSVGQALLLEGHPHTTDGLRQLHGEWTKLFRLQLMIQNVRTCCNTLRREGRTVTMRGGKGRSSFQTIYKTNYSEHPELI